jgi:hypothetical protein
LKLDALKTLSTNVGWLKYVHIKKLKNNSERENITPKPNTPKIVV